MPSSVPSSMPSSMIAKSRNPLLPALAFTLMALTLTPQPQAAAQIIDKVNKNLYSETANPTADIAAALARPAANTSASSSTSAATGAAIARYSISTITRVPTPNSSPKTFIVVHINIGHMDKNVDVAKKYNVPITKGVPALAVIDANGKLLYSEREKEFEHPTPEAITAFLNRWKPVNKAAPLKKS